MNNSAFPNPKPSKRLRNQIKPINSQKLRDKEAFKGELDFIINNIELIDVGEPEFCKFERAIKFDGTTPIEWVNVYGFTLGNWGLIPDDDDWQLYHIPEGKFMTLLPFTLANGLKGLKIVAALFGSEFITPPMEPKAYAKAYRQAYKFEKYCAAELVDRAYFLPPDFDDSDDDDDPV